MKTMPKQDKTSEIIFKQHAHTQQQALTKISTTYKFQTEPEQQWNSRTLENVYYNLFIQIISSYSPF